MIKIFNEDITDVNKLSNFQLDNINYSGIKYNDETEDYSAEGTLDTITVVDPDLESDEYLEIVQNIEDLEDEESKQDDRIIITCPICGETFSCEKSYIKGEIISSVENQIKEVEDELNNLPEDELKDEESIEEINNVEEIPEDDFEIVEDEFEDEETEEI